MKTAPDSFGDRLAALDLSVFKGIPTQSLAGDQRSWLAVQRAIRTSRGYVYLEIGSHLGGSIQQHVVDPWCRHIISIDKRPASQPDDRGPACIYDNNSTARMMKNLRRIAPDQTCKVTCFDADVSEVDPAQLPAAPDFCFIDGEHTHAAVLADFEFCLRVSSPNAAICFHDDHVTFRALSAILASLQARRIPFRARKLEELTFGIFLGDCPAVHDPHILSRGRDGAEWIRGRQLRSLVPEGMRPLARAIYSRLQRSR